MALYTPGERAFLRTVGRIGRSNPFLPERRALERRALEEDYVEVGPVWSVRGDPRGDDPNVVRLLARLEPLLEKAQAARPRALDDEERAVYQDAALFLLFHRFRADFDALIEQGLTGARGSRRVPFFRAFVERLEALMRPARGAPPHDPAHLFALFFQLRRAFTFTYEKIVGGSAPAAELRGALWQSIFTHDLERYRAGLFRGMRDFTTLITGPSGSGKELVAQAIGLSQYVPLDPGTGELAEAFSANFFALNLSAFSPTLIESELFGHRQGAFTGALHDRVGWLERASGHGAVFLDEIGELDEELQVKLLRVLQSRTFHRLGDTEPRTFAGKLIAATHRDLAAAIEHGKFRADFYYRLCSDVVTTPSLQAQLADAPGELREMLRFILRRLALPPESVEAIAAETESWIGTHLGPDYPWPGNFRELEQCVRNVLIRGEYRPPRGARPPETVAPRAGAGVLAKILGSGDLSAEGVLRVYCTWVYAQTGSYLETARRLGIDRRTVKSRVDAELLGRFGPPPEAHGRR